MRTTWTQVETAKLKELLATGNTSVFEIARELERTYASVASKIDRLRSDEMIKTGHVPPSPYPTWNSPLRSEGDAVILTDIEAPFQHSEFINRVIDLAFAWGIKTLHLAGDLLHYDNLSAWGAEWTQGKKDVVDVLLETLEEVLPTDARAVLLEKLEAKGLLPQSGLSDELKNARKVFRAIDSFDTILVALGNHDDRYLRALNQALDPDELLHQLDRHNDPHWKIAPYYYTMLDTKNGTFRITHPRNAGKNAAVDLSVQHHSHVIMGHSHRWNVSRDPSGKFWSIQTGHCVDEERLAYVMQRDAKRDAHVLGATIVRDGYPFVLSPESPFDLLERM